MNTSVEPQARPAVDRPTTPAWLWAALLVGAAVNVWWALFVKGFLKEPSAVGRVEAVLLTSIALSSISVVAAAVGAAGLLRRESWARPVAWIGAVALTLSGAGAVGGVPALVGLVWSRKAERP
jgi:hypothetical protein